MVLGPVRESVLAASTIQVKLMACLARGDIAGALVLYEAETGEAAPAWLQGLQSAYAVTNQVAGRCQQVARVIHTALTQLGQSPQYIAFKTRDPRLPYMTFDLVGGAQASVSRNNYHVAVRLGDLVYDAYTGPLGMKLSEYLSRLHAGQEIAWELVDKP